MWPQLASFDHFTNTATSKTEGQDTNKYLLNKVTYILHQQMQVFSK